MKHLPIKAGSEFAKKYKQSQVIIVTWDDEDHLMHTVSYGTTRRNCEEAAMGMNMVRRALGFEAEKCNDLPSCVAADHDRAERALGLHEPFQPDPTCQRLIQNPRLAGIVAWGLRKLGITEF